MPPRPKMASNPQRAREGQPRRQAAPAGRPEEDRLAHPLLTERDAAKLLGVSVTYLRRLRRLGLVPAYALPPARGGRPTVRYSPRDLQTWLERRRARGWKLP